MVNRLKRIKLHTYHIAALMFIGLILGSIGVGILVQSNPLITYSDAYFYELIHHGFRSQFLDKIVDPFNFNFLPDYLSPGRLPSYLYFMGLTGLIILWFKNRPAIKWYLFCLVFGVVLAMVVTALDWHFVFRDRPFLSLNNYVDDFGKMAWGKLSSYPSGHARETALISTIIAGFIPFLRWPLFAFVIFITLSRVYIGAHYPTDAIAGSIIGFIAGVISLMVGRELQSIKRISKKSEITAHKKEQK